jgi:hypothetical protein
MDFQRRALFLRCVALTGLALWPTLGKSAPRFGLKQFIALSAQLTGRQPQDLDPEMAVRLFRIFEHRGLSLRLAQLARSPSRHPVLAQELIAAWYTGVCWTASGSTVLAFNEALLWDVAEFLHAPSTCGGPTNYWSRPPDGVMVR